MCVCVCMGSVPAAMQMRVEVFPGSMFDILNLLRNNRAQPSRGGNCGKLEPPSLGMQQLCFLKTGVH